MFCRSNTRLCPLGALDKWHIGRKYKATWCYCNIIILIWAELRQKPTLWTLLKVSILISLTMPLPGQTLFASCWFFVSRIITLYLNLPETECWPGLAFVVDSLRRVHNVSFLVERLIYHNDARDWSIQRRSWDLVCSCICVQTRLKCAFAYMLESSLSACLFFRLKWIFWQKSGSKVPVVVHRYNFK